MQRRWNAAFLRTYMTCHSLFLTDPNSVSSGRNDIHLGNRCAGQLQWVSSQDGLLLLSLDDSATPWYMVYGGAKLDVKKTCRFSDGTLSIHRHTGIRLLVSASGASRHLLQ